MRNEVLAETRVVRQVDGGRKNRVENKSLMVSKPASDMFPTTEWRIGENPSARLAGIMLHFEEDRNVYDIASKVCPDASRIEEE